jgi:hypothetical protein
MRGDIRSLIYVTTGGAKKIPGGEWKFEVYIQYL